MLLCKQMTLCCLPGLRRNSWKFDYFDIFLASSTTSGSWEPENSWVGVLPWIKLRLFKQLLSCTCLRLQFGSGKCPGSQKQVTGHGGLFNNFLSYIYLFVLMVLPWPSAVLPSSICTQCHLDDRRNGALPGSGVGEPTNRCGLLQAEVQIPGGDGWEAGHGAQKQWP